MSYQVIARKWRPKSFGELIGQHHVSQTLENALKADRMPHALLFTGPRGTGKTSSARILAKSLRCPNATNFVPCNQCTECEDIASGRAVNVVEIDGASNNGVDAIRELRETVGYMPSTGKHKVYIIDEVHMLSGSAFNALLKTLEEPPPHVIFIMATTEVQKIPATILSRCQRFDFRRIPLRMITEHLKEICAAESVAAETEALWLIARQGDGSMRDSQSLLEQVISFTDSRLTAANVTDVLGLTDRSLLIKTVKALVERDANAALAVVNGFYTSGHDPSLFVKDLLEEIRHLLIVKVIGSAAPEAIDVSLEEIEHLRELGAKLSEEDIHMLFDMCLKGTQDVLKSPDTRIVLEMLLLRMASAPRVREINFGPVATKPQIQQRAPVAQSSPEPTPAPTTTVSGVTSTEKWINFVSQVKKVNSAVGAKLEHLKLVHLDNQKIQIGIPEQYKFLADDVKSADFTKKISNYLKTFWDKNLGFEVVALSSANTDTAISAHEINERDQKTSQDNIREQVEKHPLVQTINSNFNVQITSIKERL